MEKTTTTIVGFLIAPLTASVIIAALTPLGPYSDLLSYLGLVPIFYFFAAATTVLLALPVFLVLRHYNCLSWHATILAGAAIGEVANVVLGWPSIPSSRDTITFMLTGVTSALSFWLVWKGLSRENQSKPRDTAK